MRFSSKKKIAPGKKMYLAFGASDEVTDVFVNGKKLFTWKNWSKPFLVDITGVYRHGQRNLLAVKVAGGRGMGGLWGPIYLAMGK